MSALEVKHFTSKDSILARVKLFLLGGWPDYLDSPELKPFYHCRHELSVKDGCILWGSRVVIPP